MQLNEILEKEEKFRKLYTKIESKKELDKNKPDAEKILETIEKFMPSIYAKVGSDRFSSLTDVFGHSFMKLGFNDEDVEEHVLIHLSGLIEKVYDHLDVFDNPYIDFSLERCITSLNDNVSFIGEVNSFLLGYAPEVLLELPGKLLNAEQKLPPEHMKQLMEYIALPHGLHAEDCFLDAIRHLPDLIKLEGFTKQKDTFFSLLSTSETNGSFTSYFMREFKTFCEEFDQAGLLPYLDLIMENIQPVLKKAPYNITFLSRTNTTTRGEKEGTIACIQQYEQEGLDFSSVFKRVVSIYENIPHFREHMLTKLGSPFPSEDQSGLDPAFAFLNKYPHIHSVFGKHTDPLFLSLLSATQNNIHLHELFHSAEHYCRKKLFNKVGFRDWLEYIASEIPHAHFDIDRFSVLNSIIYGYVADQGFLLSSVAAIDNDIPLEMYSQYTRLLSENRLFRLGGKEDISELAYTTMHALAPILRSDAPDEKKRGMIRYYSLLRYVKDLPPATIDGSWLRTVSEHLQVPYEELISWMDTILHERENTLQALDIFILENKGPENFSKICETSGKNRFLRGLELGVNHMESYIENIPTILQHKIPLQESFEVGKKLPFKLSRSPDFYKFFFETSFSLEDKIKIMTPLHFNFETYENSLRTVIDPKYDADEIARFLFNISEHKNILTIKPPEDLDIKKWIREAQHEAGHYFENKGIDLECSPELCLHLLTSTKSEKSREDLLKLAKNQAEGKVTKKLFELGKMYGTERVYALNERIDPVDATKFLIYGLISNQPERIQESTQYFLPEKLSKAREYINSSHMPGRRLYHSLRYSIDLLLNGASYETKKQHVQQITEGLRERYLSNSKDVAGKTELRELIWLVESLYEGNEVFDSITAKMQDGVLMDLMDGARLMCCAMISKDRDRDEAESIYYSLDPYIGLLHITPSLNGNTGAPIGAGILANTRTYSDSSVMLVDSLEGGTLFQQVDEKMSFRLTAKGLLGAAEDSNSEYIMVNGKPGNSTSLRFNSFINSKLGISQTTVNMYKLRDTINTDRPRRFLEAFQNREELSGPVTGYMLTKEMLGELAR